MHKKNKVKSDESKTWTLISENIGSLVDKLFEVYADDKEKARIFYFLNKGDGSNFKKTRVLLFEDSNDGFRFVVLVKSYGISNTGKMHVSEKTLEAISYNKKNGFYYYNNLGRKSYIQQLNYLLLTNFISMTLQIGSSHFIGYDGTTGFIYDYIVNRFGWVRYIKDNGFYSVTFNVINRRKLFGFKSMLRYLYGCPYPQAKFLFNTNTNSSKGLTVWREMRKVLINIESLSSDMYNNPLFDDTCRFARMVGERVNCSWSPKRLKLEHDKWSKIITVVLLETEELRELNISDVYIDFAKDSGFELLTTNHALLEEGHRMGHCVGTYSDKVDSGFCAIYRVLDCTLELHSRPAGNGTIASYLSIAQFMDVGNTRVLSSYVEIVNKALEKFNEKKTFYFEDNDRNLPF